MLSITLIEFLHYSEDDFLEYLNIESDTVFKIIYPKLVCYPTDTKAQLHNNYIMAAYAGQMLFQITTSFSYYVPAPEVPEYFYFILETNNLPSLAKILYNINDHLIFKGADHYHQFRNELSLFYDQVDKGKISTGSIGLYIVAEKFVDE